MAENNFYTAEESIFGLPTIMTNNTPCGLRDFVQNESGWCELRQIEGKVTPVRLTGMEWEMFHAFVKESLGKDLPKPEPDKSGKSTDLRFQRTFPSRRPTAKATSGACVLSPSPAMPELSRGSQKREIRGGRN
jgi:hypothetical protein